jgi:hypothetical protein
VLKIQQRHHQPRELARTTGVGDASTGHGHGGAKQVQLFDLLARLDLACPAVRQRLFNFPQGHGVGQHRQRVAQSVLTIQVHPRTSAFRLVPAVLPGRQITLSYFMQSVLIFA